MRRCCGTALHFAIVLRRKEAKLFTEKQVELVATFAAKPS
jgi:hypothetical protein